MACNFHHIYLWECVSRMWIKTKSTRKGTEQVGTDENDLNSKVEQGSQENRIKVQKVWNVHSVATGRIPKTKCIAQQKGPSLHPVSVTGYPVQGLLTARFTLSNTPPFISDEFLIEKLCLATKVVSSIWKLFSGCKSLRVVRVDDFNYTLFATSSEVKCFGCVAEGHLVRACPNWVGSDSMGPAMADGAAAPTGKPVPAPRWSNSGETTGSSR